MSKPKLGPAPIRPEVAAEMNGIANAIAQALPATHGFALVVFDFNAAAGGHVSYISNGTRDDMRRVLRDLLGKWDAESPS